MSYKPYPISRLCERSEVIKIEYLTKNRSGSLRSQRGVILQFYKNGQSTEMKGAISYSRRPPRSMQQGLSASTRSQTLDGQDGRLERHGWLYACLRTRAGR